MRPETIARNARIIALAKIPVCIASIAAEIGCSRATVRKTLSAARADDPDVPKRMRRSPTHYAIPIACLVAERSRLLAMGRHTNLYLLIAQKLGMNSSTVRVRLWKYDADKRRAA
jgi:DNA-binding CsgD family transcriptional regulator